MQLREVCIVNFGGVVYIKRLEDKSTVRPERMASFKRLYSRQHVVRIRKRLNAANGVKF